MNLEELQAEILRINKLNEDLETRLKGQDEIIEGLKHKNEESANKISDYQEKIMTLRDMNTDLFLRVSQPIEPSTVEEVKPEPVVETKIEDILW